MRLSLQKYLSFLFGSLSLVAHVLTARIHCDNRLYCDGRKPSDKFLTHQRISKRIQQIVQDIKLQSKFIGNNSTVSDLLAMRRIFCVERSFSGFLLDKESNTWEQFCVWNGRDFIGHCSPAPTLAHAHPLFGAFYYLSSREWARKLKAYRMAIGCSEKEIEDSFEVAELYVCSDYCVQGGFPYFVLSIMIAFFVIGLYICCHCHELQPANLPLEQ